MKPLIAISLGYCDSEFHRLETSDRYSLAVKKAGGIPLLLPPPLEKNDIQSVLRQVDGIVLSGGVDIDPKHYSQPVRRGNGRIDPLRDEMELALVKHALKKKIPLLAICRGIQILNIACGGNIYQDLPKKSFQHMQTAPRWYPIHRVNIIAESILQKIFSKKMLRVNSFHHQAVKETGRGIKIISRAEDGTIEALEGKDHPFALGVQWHPEEMLAEYPEQINIFKYFLKQAKGLTGRK